MSDLIERACPFCGKTYVVSQKKLDSGRNICCSQSCSMKNTMKDRSISIDLTCGVCGNNFKRVPSTIRKSKHGVFCSKECHYKGRSLGLTKRVVTNPYTYSEEGKASMLNASRRKKGNFVFHFLTCENCGKEFDDPSNGRARKSGLCFCSLDCCNNYRSGENNPAWRGGYDRYYGPNWISNRRKARQRDNDTCQNCGITKEQHGKELDVHHITRFGDFSNPIEANNLSNLITLCHPCHMQIEWDTNRKVVAKDCPENQLNLF